MSKILAGELKAWVKDGMQLNLVEEMFDQARGGVLGIKRPRAVH